MSRPRDVTAAASARLAAAVTLHGADLLAFLERRVVPVEDAADLLGEVFLVATRRVADLPADGLEVRLWLFGVARGVLANDRRGRRRRLAAMQRLRDEVMRVHRVTQPASAAHEVVQEAVADLPEELRELVMLVHWDGFAIGEAARVLGLNPSTGRSRYARARQVLEAALSVEEVGHDGAQ